MQMSTSNEFLPLVHWYCQCLALSASSPLHSSYVPVVSDGTMILIAAELSIIFV